MKKIILTTLTAIFTLTLCFSQDVITKKLGEDIQAKILEVGQTEIKYKKFDNQNGSTFTILKSDVLIVRYENGTKDIFSEEKKTENVSSITQTEDQIVVKKGRYYINDKKLKNRDLKGLLTSDPESAAAYRKFKSVNTTGIVVLVVFDVALIAATGYALGVIPGMLVVLPFSMAAQKHFKNAVNIYNSKHATSSNIGLSPK